jgi:hypothetical protein
MQSKQQGKKYIFYLTTQPESPNFIIIIIMKIKDLLLLFAYKYMCVYIHGGNPLCLGSDITFFSLVDEFNML